MGWGLKGDWGGVEREEKRMGGEGEEIVVGI